MMAIADSDQEKIWRYMKFSRFVWLIQRKQLWLSRADLLGDPWEISLAGEQLQHVISRHPIVPLDLREGKRPEGAIERAKRITEEWRRHTFINCWSASPHESHALWRIYCGPEEGIAMQTTSGKLVASVGDAAVHRVTYQIPGSRRQTPTIWDLATKKRPMFEYEHEVRVVLYPDSAKRKDLKPEALGYGLDWDPETNLDSIRVHPEADASFMDTTRAMVDQYAPALHHRVAWSDMNARPPF